MGEIIGLKKLEKEFFGEELFEAVRSLFIEDFINPSLENKLIELRNKLNEFKNGLKMSKDQEDIRHFNTNLDCIKEEIMDIETIRNKAYRFITK